MAPIVAGLILGYSIKCDVRILHSVSPDRWQRNTAWPLQHAPLRESRLDHQCAERWGELKRLLCKRRSLESHRLVKAPV